MILKRIARRTSFFVAVEGEGEQSFIAWLQRLSDRSGLHIYLDCHVLGGGGYKTMLAGAVRCSKQKKAHTQLRNMWRDYQKPADARTLDSKFVLDDLLRVARVDSELRKMLTIIGYII